MRVAEDQARWRKIGEPYVEQWTVLMMMMIYLKLFDLRWPAIRWKLA
jgi:hypothetical protein